MLTAGRQLRDEIRQPSREDSIPGITFIIAVTQSLPLTSPMQQRPEAPGTEAEIQETLVRLMKKYKYESIHDTVVLQMRTLERTTRASEDSHAVC